MEDAICLIAIGIFIIFILAIGFLFWRMILGFIMRYVKNPYVAIAILILIFLIVAGFSFVSL